MSLRLAEKMAAELAAIARTEDMPLSEAVRAAIAEHISSRRTDAEFQQRLKRQLEEDREVLEHLASEEAPPDRN
ncbi:MAG TPA: ribbon-helix-helix protein, CopG family [Solirubrobacterales bacterium]